MERQNWHDAVDGQLALIEWMRTSFGQKWMQVKFDMESAHLASDTAEMLRSMYESEERRLMGASPYFVSREMSELVAAAAESFEPEPIYPSDFLSLSGFMFYEKPFPITARFDTPTTIKAVSWQPMMSRGAPPDRVLTREDEYREWIAERKAKGLADGIAISIYSDTKTEVWPDHFGPAPPIIPMHVTPWWWGMSFNDDPVLRGEDGAAGASWWWKIIQTTLRLMQQKLSVRHVERPTRPQRREQKRVEVKESDVVVVRLRREKGKGTDEPMSEANYSHRFVVGGHWRNQPYPAEGVHRQIWIADYIKGPEDLPLVIKPNRVFNWTR